MDREVKQCTIYVALLDEGTDVWRPVEAEQLPNGTFRIISDNPDPEDEHWEFPPGSLVRCERRPLSGKRFAVALAENAVQQGATG